MNTTLLALFSFLIAFLTARQVVRNSGDFGLNRIADHRSMHIGSVAHGGGIGIVIAGTAAGLWLSLTGASDLLPLVLASAALGLTGLLDDIYHLPRHVRLLVQITVAVVVVGDAWPLPDPFAPLMDTPAILLAGLAIAAFVWWVNLFNFMDGIDGLAATESIFLLVAGVAAAAWTTPASVASHPAIWCLAVAAASLGFLVLNWPPARLFMGDTSSLYLPVVVFGLALTTISQQHLTYPFWIVLVAAFVADATVTLVRRILTGQKWIDSHRSHTYQKLAIRAGSHRPILLLYNAINLFWLLPISLACLAWPGLGWHLVAIAYVPLIALALQAGAGKP